MSSQSESSRELGSFFGVLLMSILALLLPFAYHMDVGPGPDSIRAMVWDHVESDYYSGFRLWSPLDTIPYTLLRLVFAVMLGRVYGNRATPRKTLLVGLLAEFQSIAVSAPLTYLVDWTGDPLVPLYIPLPFLFIVGVLVYLFVVRSARRQTAPRHHRS